MNARNYKYTVLVHVCIIRYTEVSQFKLHLNCDAVTMATVRFRQRCVRELTSCVTRFINAFDDTRGRRYDDGEGRGRTAKLWRRAADNCTAVADRALPRLVEAIRATITRPTSDTALMQLINAASDAVRVRYTKSWY